MDALNWCADHPVIAGLLVLFVIGASFGWALLVAQIFADWRQECRELDSYGGHTGGTPSGGRPPRK